MSIVGAGFQKMGSEMRRSGHTGLQAEVYKLIIQIFIL
jgi:hypothetical protein